MSHIRIKYTFQTYEITRRFKSEKFVVMLNYIIYKVYLYE